MQAESKLLRQYANEASVANPTRLRRFPTFHFPENLFARLWRGLLDAPFYT